MAYACYLNPAIANESWGAYASNIIEFPTTSTVGSLFAKGLAIAGAGAMVGSCFAPAAYPEKENEDDDSFNVTYYGCIAHKNKPLVFVTGPMAFWDAYDWATSASRLSEYGKGKNWGLYTLKNDDAFDMAWTLGEFLPPIHDSQRIGSGMNNHYHVYGRVFQAYFSHFHVWYEMPQ